MLGLIVVALALGISLFVALALWTYTHAAYALVAWVVQGEVMLTPAETLFIIVCAVGAMWGIRWLWCYWREWQVERDEG